MIIANGFYKRGTFQGPAQPDHYAEFEPTTLHSVYADLKIVKERVRHLGATHNNTSVLEDTTRDVVNQTWHAVKKAVSIRQVQNKETFVFVYYGGRGIHMGGSTHIHFDAAGAPTVTMWPIEEKIRNFATYFRVNLHAFLNCSHRAPEPWMNIERTQGRFSLAWVN